MENIKNIVLDFGGVLLDLDYKRTYQAFSKLLGFDFDPKSLSIETVRTLNAYEKGKITSEDFISDIKALSKNGDLKDVEIIDAWNAMLLGWDDRKFAFLLALREKYKVYLLSNTNHLHIEWVYQDLKDQHQIHDYDERYFDKTYYSHLIGMRKPDAEIFAWVNEDANFITNETLFIDDLSANIESAAKIGWNTYHHNPADDLIEVFTKKLKLL